MLLWDSQESGWELQGECLWCLLDAQVRKELRPGMSAQLRAPTKRHDSLHS